MDSTYFLFLSNMLRQKPRQNLVAMVLNLDLAIFLRHVSLLEEDRSGISSSREEFKEHSNNY